jgi:hypothetical protein
MKTPHSTPVDFLVQANPFVGYISAKLSLSANYPTWILKFNEHIPVDVFSLEITVE